MNLRAFWNQQNLPTCNAFTMFIRPLATLTNVTGKRFSPKSIAVCVLCSSSLILDQTEFRVQQNRGTQPPGQIHPWLSISVKNFWSGLLLMN